MGNKSMTMQERLDDIVAISGLSEAIVRQVLKSTAISTEKSIKNGERALVPYLCKMKPIFKRKVLGTGETSSVLDVRLDPVAGFSSRFEGIVSFKDIGDTEEQDLGIRCAQIEGIL